MKKEENKKNEETKKVKKSSQKEETVKVVENELKEKKEEVKTSNAKEAKGPSDKVVIFIVIGICLLIALGVFGFVIYKSNYKAIVSTEYGIVNQNEYTVYYKMFAPMLQYYGYSESEIPEVIANKAGTDKIILAKAKALGVTLTEENAKDINEVFSDTEQISTWKESGINVGILRKLYEEDYIISNYITKIGKDASDDDIIKYIKDNYGDTADMTEYNTRHILIKTSKTSEDGSSSDMTEQEKADALAKAQALLARANAGEDFGTLAKENSEDKGTAVEDGKFTFYDSDSVLDEYKNAAKTLNDGQIYQTVVETSAGYHVIKMDTKVENGRKNNSSDRSAYANSLVNNYSTTEKIDIKTDALNSLIETITGKKVDSKTEEKVDGVEEVGVQVATE